jgi:hypothetical protein
LAIAADGFDPPLDGFGRSVQTAADANTLKPMTAKTSHCPPPTRRKMDFPTVTTRKTVRGLGQGEHGFGLQVDGHATPRFLGQVLHGLL